MVVQKRRSVLIGSTGALITPLSTVACPSSRRFSVYGREAAAYVQSLGLKAVAVV